MQWSLQRISRTGRDMLQMILTRCHAGLLQQLKLRATRHHAACWCSHTHSEDCLWFTEHTPKLHTVCVFCLLLSCTPPHPNPPQWTSACYSKAWGGVWQCDNPCRCVPLTLWCAVRPVCVCLCVSSSLSLDVCSQRMCIHECAFWYTAASRRLFLLEAYQETRQHTVRFNQPGWKAALCLRSATNRRLNRGSHAAQGNISLSSAVTSTAG